MILAASQTDTATESSRVGVSTVIGMVLGVFSLFSIVIAYQLIPRKRKPSRTIRSLAPPPPKPTPLLTRFRIACTTLLRSFHRTQPVPEKHQPQPGTQHRTLRSFHLTPERKQQRDAIRKKLASTLRINVDLPLRRHAHLGEKTAPGKYKRLDDDESQVGLLKPDTAVISPWSPSEEYYSERSPALLSPTSTLLSPPPVYVPGTPLRATYYTSDSDGSNDPPTPSTLSPVTPMTPKDTAASLDAAKSLIAEVEEVIQYTKEWSENPFVVAGDDDDDAESVASGDWETSV